VKLRNGYAKRPSIVNMVKTDLSAISQTSAMKIQKRLECLGISDPGKMGAPTSSKADSRGRIVRMLGT
jgi:hypothetical protein